MARMTDRWIGARIATGLSHRHVVVAAGKNIFPHRVDSAWPPGSR